MEAREVVTSTPSEVSSTYSSSSSLYFRRRYDGKKTRREAMEQRFGKNSTPTSRESPVSTPVSKQSPLSRNPADATSANASDSARTDRHLLDAPPLPDASFFRHETEPHTPPRLAPKQFPRLSSSDNDSNRGEESCQRIPNIPSAETAETTETTITTATSEANTQQSKPSFLKNPESEQGADDEAGDATHEVVPPRRPQHVTCQSETSYYRIVYRGVVALLSDPSTTAQRSGAYVSYGEIVTSTWTGDVQEPALRDAPSTPSRTIFTPKWRTSDKGENCTGQECNESMACSSSQTAGSGSSSTGEERACSDQQHDMLQAGSQTSTCTSGKAIRVDSVLTGGYAIDACDGRTEAYDQTPKRGNTQNAIPVVGPSPLPMAHLCCSSTPPLSPRVKESIGDERIGHASNSSNYGYLITKRRDIPIAEPIEKPPKCETGNFLYKVVSSTPLPILTGPCWDAPKTKAMLLPGTVHEVCLRLSFAENGDHRIFFLRLSRRKGWIADRKVSSRSSTQPLVPLMKELSNENTEASGDDNSVSAFSKAASSVATPASTARRRHRPPRRKRVVKDGSDPTSLPRQVIGPSSSNGSHHSLRQDMLTSFESALIHPSDKGVMSPSSNVSMLSDESSLEQALTHAKLSGVLTPDRSVARSTASSSCQPSFYLMRVNAPRGLRILDAPHFQVNNLIHGSHPMTLNSTSPKGPKDLAGQTGNQSIFQTMAGHHTTTLTSKIGNPAIFDSITRSRKLPRGSLFEASKRMESSGAFSQGAGLIKLSDNSGWAIVPRQEELDEQYRNYHGALSGVKEGEATRAFEEVGNCVADERCSTLYLRVVSKVGVVVSLPPPPSTLSDDDTSPTSSAAGSSALSAGATSSLVSKDESDVASSVGSSFLDSMFRTPKKRDSDAHHNDTRREGAGQHIRNPNPVPVERATFSTVIPCGICVEVDKWLEPKDPADQRIHRQEFARLRGGQGWIPRFLNGKQVLETVPPPEFRFGSFWFQVQARNGIKVRLGPSRRAPSIKSDEGAYFRFECGEFLRVSEIMTVFRENAPYECFAKLFRNRHVRLNMGHGEVRQLASLTVQAEWVQVYSQEDIFLEECTTEPRIERHRQGWRYNVVLDARVQVRKGPSFFAEANGVVLLGGESVLINERVSVPGDSIMWLRLKDGQGWVHSCDRDGQALMIPHSLRHRKKLNGGGRGGAEDDGQDDIAYNQIIARLFHGDLPEDTYSSSREIRGLPR